MAKKGKDTKGKKNAKQDDVEENSGGGKGKLIIIIVAALVVLGGGGGAAAFFLLGGDSAPVAEADGASDVETVEAPKRIPKGDARYVDLDPDFTINMESDANVRFAQIGVSLLTYFDDTEDAIKENLPIIRNNIILMIGRKTSGELGTARGKSDLQTEIKDEVEKVITENGGDGVMNVEQVFFTKFVMQ